MWQMIQNRNTDLVTLFVAQVAQKWNPVWLSAVIAHPPQDSVII